MPDDRVSVPFLTEHARDLELYGNWGVHVGPWLLSQNLKILIVIDGTINLSTTGFGLGLLLDILRDPAYAWWVDFEVDVARRKDPALGTPTVVASPGAYEVKYDFFRFDQPGFDLDHYDQVWFFGFRPGNDNGPDTNIGLPANAPLDDAELKLLAKWMDSGGGVFATGDHDYLGASMCSRIPRVRTMRKWTNAQGVPPIGGPTRLDTNQPANPAQAASTEFMPFANQGDRTPQPIDVVLEDLGSHFPFIINLAPHPILCAPAGIISVLPDHPHEGEVIDDDEVALDLPLDIPGYSNPEYPGGAGRPVPKVIAHGRTTHGQTTRVKGVVNARRFGLIGVYDGEPVEIGRVVVQSTWHHLFSENLVGFQAGNPTVFGLLKSYFRNVALWLARPLQRRAMLVAASWGVVVGSGPMEFPPGASIWDLGRRAKDAIGRTASQCLLRDWVSDLVAIDVFDTLPVRPDPCLSCPPFELVEEALIGGIAKGLLIPAFDLQERASLGQRPIIDPDAIARGAIEGVRLGQEELAAALEDGARMATQVAEVAPRAFREPRVLVPDVGLARVKVTVEAVQVVDPLDPALVGQTVVLTVRAVVDDTLAGVRTYERQLPDFDRRGAFLDLEDEPLADLMAWHGSTLTLTVAAGREQTGVPPPHGEERGRASLTGRPETWQGRHGPAVDTTDRWRLWFRVDLVAVQP